MTDVVIASAARTAIGSFGRSLRDVPPAELGATVARAAIDRAGLEPEQVEQVVFGNVIHTAAEDMYMARVVGIKAGIPKEAPAFRSTACVAAACRRSSRPRRQFRRAMRMSCWPAVRSR